MGKNIVTFRTDPSRIKILDKLADHQQRNRSFLINEALDQYLETQEWQVRHIEAAVEEADQGKFVDAKAMDETFSRLRDKCK